MTAVAALAVFAVAGLLSWLLRIAFITLLPAGRLPEPVQRSLGYVAPAALAVLPAMSLSPSASESLGWPGVGAAVVTVCIAWRTRSLLATVLAGVGAFAVLSAVA
jgi:branched-subunit amino acid transport protein